MTQSRMLFAMLVCGLLTSLPMVYALISHAESRPTRSECIIGFRLDWSEVKGDRHEVRNSLHLGPEGVQKIKAEPAIVMSQGGTRLYLQFRRNCEKKQDLAAEVMSYWRSKGLDLPRFERINEPIVPSTDTIEVWGPSWRDKPEDSRGTPKIAPCIEPGSGLTVT